MTAPGTFLCTYCARRLLTSKRSTEHPLGQAIGGRGYSMREVCDECNREAGKQVDRPFAEQPFILAARHVHEIPDPHSGEVPPAPRLYGDIEGGGRAYVELGPGLEVRRVAQAQEHEGGVRYTVDVGEAEQLIEKLVRRLEKLHGPGVRIEATTTTIRDEATAKVELPPLSMTLWPRFGAKLGLAFGREVLGVEWLASAQASHLRDVLWERDTDPDDLDAIWDTVEAQDAFARLVPTPGHLLAIHRGEHGAMLIVQMFGRMRYGVPLSDEPQPRDDWTMWVFDPVAGTASQMGFSELIRQSAARGQWGGVGVKAPS
jgi:hypothetical protein